MNYWHTLKSIQPNERILVSCSISTHAENVPDHVDLQLNKSVLDALAKDKITRKQAMDEISVREY